MYDIVIIGGGPSGLTASIYSCCFHLSHVVITKELGGQMSWAPSILNYPGFERISGKKLAEKMKRQIIKMGGEIEIDEVVKVDNACLIPKQFQHKITFKDCHFILETAKGKTFHARSVILATGTERRKLNVKGENEYFGKGVHYCVNCEKQDYKGKTVVVVGGSNSAAQAAVELSQSAKKVFIIYRGNMLRGDPIWLKKIAQNHKIEVLYYSVVNEVIGNGKKVTGVAVQTITGSITDKKSASSRHIECQKIFIEIGGMPGTALVKHFGVKTDNGGYIEVNSNLATSVPGVYAAGDLIGYGVSIEQITSSVGLGARAASSVFAFLTQGKAPTLWGGSQIKRPE